MLQHRRRENKNVRVGVYRKDHYPSQREHLLTPCRIKLTPYHNGHPTPTPDNQTSLRYCPCQKTCLVKATGGVHTQEQRQHAR